MRLIALLITILLAPIVKAQSEPDILSAKPDTVSAVTAGHLRPSQFIAPAALIGIGAWGVGNGWLKSVNRHIGRSMKWNHPGALDDVAQFVPAAAVMLPWSERYDWRQRAIMVVTAEIITEVIVQPTKRLVHAARPDGSDNRSFPSGHAARAFMGAELLRQTHGTWPGVAGYVFATGVAALRISAGRHYLTDVVGGAGVGILSAQLARLLLPAEQRLFGISQKRAAQMAIIPTVAPGQLSATVCLTL